MKDKILSVSVAAYNVEQYLSKIFDILKSSKEVTERIEFIIVNDGSKDKTVTIAQKYRELYPNSIIIIDKENGGYGSTINAAIKIASGKYFRLLDGDDWFNSANIEEYIKFLNNIDSDIVVSPYERVYEETGRYELIDRQDKVGFTCFLHMAEICIKTQIYRDARKKISENCFYTDTEFAVLAMLISNSYAKFEKPIYCYRIGREGQSVSNDGRIKHYKDNEHVLMWCFQVYNEFSYEKQLKKKDILLDQIVALAIFHFRTLLLFHKDKKNLYELKKFENKVKKLDKYVYFEMQKRSKIVKLIRISRYSLYFFIK